MNTDIIKNNFQKYLNLYSYYRLMYGKINLPLCTKCIYATKSLIADFVADKLELIARY